MGDDLKERLIGEFGSGKNIQNWLNDRNLPVNREQVFRIAFALELTEYEADELLSYVFGDGIHYRNERELLFAFALKNHQTFEAALASERILQERKNLPDKQIVLSTQNLRLAFEALPEDADYMQFMMDHQNSFGTLHDTAYRYFISMLSYLEDIGDSGRSYSTEYICNNYLRMGVPKEQYTRHGKQGPYTDIYSVGATFYFAITGRRPPDSIDRLEEDELVPPSRLGVDIPALKEEAILFAMNVQPNQRFQSMTAFRQALSETGIRKAEAVQPEPVKIVQFRQEPVQPVPAQPVQPVPVQPVQPVPAQPVQPVPVQPVQPVPAQPTQPVSQQPEQPKQHKWILPVGIGACGVGVVAIIAAIVIASGGGKSDDRQTAYYEEDDDSSSRRTNRNSETDSQTAEETVVVDSSRNIVGNDPNNITNQAQLAIDEPYLYVAYPGNGLVIGDENDSTIVDNSSYVGSFNIVGDYLYYIDGDYRACYTKKDGSGSGAYVRALQSYKMSRLWVAENGYFFEDYNSGDASLYYVDSAGNNMEQLTGFYDANIAFMDDYVYYVDSDISSGIRICRVPAGNLGASEELVYTFTDLTNAEVVYSLVAADGVLYFYFADLTKQWLVGYDVSAGQAYGYGLSDLLGEMNSCSLSVGGGYVYIATDINDYYSTLAIKRTTVRDFLSGTINIETVYSTSTYQGIWGLNLISDSDYMSFCAFDYDWKAVLVGMSMDGSGDPAILSE